jgi:A/G-specific adenine glycosylase
MKYGRCVAQDTTTINNFKRAVLAWYQKNGRHFPWRNKSASQYQRIVSEVLLQRTKAETVANYFHFFINKYPSWKTLAKATEEELGMLIRPLGLWKRRASSLLKLAQDMSKKNGRFPKEREDIEQLPNVGQYISNAILLFCQSWYNKFRQ